MNRFFQRIFLLTATIFWAGVAESATISWGNPQNISDDNDIPSGLIDYVALNANGAVVTINGTTFSDSSSVISINGNTYSDFGTVTGLSEAYNNLLKPANWAVTSISLNNLSPGSTYRVWIWSSDARPCCGAAGRTTTLDGKVTLDECVGDVGGNGGQFVSGTFTADNTIQTIPVSSQTGADHAVINAVLLETLSHFDPADQSSDADTNHTADKAVDGDPATWSQTQDRTDSWWRYIFPTEKTVAYIEVVAPPSAGARMGGLTIRVLNSSSNTVASTTMSNPGDGGTWTWVLPSAVTAKYLWIGLENGTVNDYGDHVVALAEVRTFPSFNLAVGKDSYMVRLNDSLPPPSLGNDGDPSTYTESTWATVDGYWEVDLGTMYHLTNIVVRIPSGFEDKMTHATVRLFDENHDSVWSQHFPSTAASVREFVPNGVRCARYVRVGFELKERSTSDGSIGWHLGVAEVEAYGEPASAVGIRSFSASSDSIIAGQSVTLSWDTHALSGLRIYPDIGAVSGPSGSVTVSPTNSTCYTLVGTNECGFFSKSVSVTVNGGALPLRITEFMAENKLTIEDGEGDTPDWIEIFNPSSAAVNLAGYGLSDDPLQPFKWTFPVTNIAPHARLIVFASGKTDPDPKGFLHASFKLGDGDSIVLTSPDGTVIDAVTNFPPQKTDLAYGRLPDGNGWKFIEPTPGRFNYAQSYEGWVKTPVFDHTRGIYTNTFLLAISNRTDGATVYYSTDGSEPSTEYTGPLAVSATMTVRAKAVRPGWKPSRVRTHTYIFPDDVLDHTAWKNSSYISADRARAKKGLLDLPIISVSATTVPDDYTETRASMEIIYPDGSHSDIQEDCGLVRFGNSWQEFSKRQYRLKFKKEYGAPKLSAKILEGFDRGFPVANEFDQIDLRSGSQDMKDRGAYMSNRFADDTMLDMGNLNPHGRFVHLFINGKYYGQFHFRERLTAGFLAAYLPGKKKDFYNIKGNDNDGPNFVPGTPDPLYRNYWRQTLAYKGDYQHQKEYVDMSSLIDFMLLWFYGNCESEFRAASSAGPGSGEKFWMADADGLLRDPGDRTSSPGPSGFFGALVQEGDPDFMTLLADHIYKHLFHGGALTPEANLARLNERTEEIQDAFVLEAARWDYRSPSDWANYVQGIRDNLFPGRTQALFSQLRSRGLYPAFDPPEFSQHGGLVPEGYQPTLTAATGTIYYTVDGSDPRLPGGAISSNALVWTASGQGSEEILIPAGSAWKYLDDGSNQGTAWRDPSFDDSAWKEGNAQLGYGDGDETTVVSYGPDADNKYITTYFRRTFTVDDPSKISSLILRLVRDDGAVIYVNGTEVVRDNMPSGTIDYQTRASVGVANADESTFWEHSIPTSVLRTGENTIAVEIHQILPTSSDISFDLELKAVLTSTNAPITITNDTVICTRVLLNGKWSALNRVQFLLQNREPASISNTVITEIHYNPDGSDDTEFIELRNTNPSNIVDFTGVEFTDGVSFRFPDHFALRPGQFAVVVEDADAFSNRYCRLDSPWYYGGIIVAGQWNGGLNNDGEKVELTASNGLPIAVIRYNDGLDWPDRADGGGSSLELRDPDAVPVDPTAREAFYENPFNWRSSRLVHGSPGRIDRDPRKVVINEVLSHTDATIDWIELHNLTDTDVNVGGLYLTDHRDRPFRFQIPANTVIPAHGFITYNTNDLHFGFSELGSEALLLEADGTNLVRFVDTVDFPAAEREIPFGRYTRSDGKVDFTELDHPTRGASNAPPRIGPVVISEILYNPEPGKAEFVELANISGQTVKMYDPALPTNTWQLSGAVDYQFPKGLEIGPGEAIVICSTNPAAFRAQYGLADTVRVYGPWNGRLDNAGENLKLRYPGDPEPDGFVPYYRMDHVSYRPFAPWPIVSTNGGESIERMPLSSYGNDPANWRKAATLTPGDAALNHPPVLDPVNDLTYPADVDFSLQLNASDPDVPAQPLTFSQTGLPAGLSLDPATGLISGICRTPGSYTVTVTVSDNQQSPLTDTRTFVLTISEPFRLKWEKTLFTNGLFGFSFPAITGEIYQVEYSPTLTPPNWKVERAVQAGADKVEILLDPNQEGTTGFYRVKWIR